MTPAFETQRYVIMTEDAWRKIVATYPIRDGVVRPYVSHPYSAPFNGRCVAVIETIGM